MRLLFVTARYWPAVGGIESFVRHVAQELAQRHDVTVVAQRLDSGPARRLEASLALPRGFEPFDDGPVRVVPLRLSSRQRAAVAPLAVHVVPGLRRYAHGRQRLAATNLFARAAAPVIADADPRADVVHMWGGDLLGGAALRAARALQRPFAVTPFAHEGQWGDDLAAARTYRDADAVLALLQEDAALYRRLGVASERIDVCGVCSPGAAGGDGAAIRARHDIRGPLVLFLGVRRPYKGFDLLLDAAKLVRAPRGDVTFAFVGPGPALDVRDAGILDVGRVDDAARADWLAAADLLCLPSQGEIFPVSVLEAWSAGTPVLTSDLATLRELVAAGDGGETALRTPEAFAQAIGDLLARPEELRRRGASGRELWRERYTVAAVAAAHERAYARLVSSGAELCVA